MQEPLFDIFGTQSRGPTPLNRPGQANLKVGENSILDMKAGSIKRTQKKCLVDVKNRLALGPVTDNRAAVLKPQLSTPAFSKNTCPPIGSQALKSTVRKREPLKSDSSIPSIFVDEVPDDCEIPDVPEMGDTPCEEDNYEDLLPQSERFTDDQIHKLINFWDLTRPPLSSNSPPREPVPFDVSTPELQVPDLDISVPDLQLPPVPIMPSFQIWQDDME